MLINIASADDGDVIAAEENTSKCVSRSWDIFRREKRSLKIALSVRPSVRMYVREYVRSKRAF